MTSRARTKFASRRGEVGVAIERAALVTAPATPSADEPVASVLLVDDEPANLLALEATLEPLGARLVRANGGVDALRALLRQQFAVVLLDVHMPDIDGIETAALMRSRAQTRETPTIFLTAMGEAPELMARGYEAGAVDYIAKPYDPYILRAKVAVFLELYRSRERLRLAQTALVQAEKMSALGQMVAGVAHEVNNPLAFVLNNLTVMTRDVRLLREHYALYGRASGAIAAADPALAREIAEHAERIDVAYTQANLEELIVSARDGLERIDRIVRDLRDFARLDAGDLSECDINTGIRSTLNVLRHHARERDVELTAALDDVSAIRCYPGKINQVIMNLVGNAIDASPPHSTVHVETRSEGDGVRIRVVDQGSGIDPALGGRVFDPFFTTKEIGKGTGLGLSISFGIVRDHGGTITFEPTGPDGTGTTFVVWLPRSMKKMTTPVTET